MAKKVKRVGRPKLTGPDAPATVAAVGKVRRYKRISIVPSVDLLARIERWRKAQDGKPAETRATLLLVELGLKADGF